MSRNLRHSEKDNFLSDEQFQFMHELEHGPSSSGLNGTTSANPVVASVTPSLNPPWNPYANQGLNQNPSLNPPWNPYGNQGLNQNPSLNPPWNPYGNQGLNQSLPSGGNIAASATPGLNPPQNANALYTLATVKEALLRDQIQNKDKQIAGSSPKVDGPMLKDTPNTLPMLKDTPNTLQDQKQKKDRQIAGSFPKVDSMLKDTPTLQRDRRQKKDKQIAGSSPKVCGPILKDTPTRSRTLPYNPLARSHPPLQPPLNVPPTNYQPTNVKLNSGYGGSLPGISQSSSGTLPQPQPQSPVNVQQNVKLNSTFLQPQPQPQPPVNVQQNVQSNSGYGGSLPGISQSSSGTFLQPQPQPPVNVQQNVQLNRLNPLGTTDPRYQQPNNVYGVTQQPSLPEFSQNKMPQVPLRSFDQSFLEKYMQFQISQAVSTLEFFWGVRLQYEPPQSEPSTFGPSHASGSAPVAQFAGTTAQSASQPIGSTFSANHPYYSSMGPNGGTPNSNAGTS
ncbi:hypothetical protein ACP275_01G051500 [Erythranthe tilingii]